MLTTDEAGQLFRRLAVLKSFVGFSAERDAIEERLDAYERRMHSWFDDVIAE